MDFVGPPRNPDMAVDGAALLSKAGHVEDGAALSLKMRRHAEQGSDRDDAGSPHSGNENPIWFVKPGKRRLGQWRQVVFPQISRFAPLQCSAMYRDKARAESLDARKVLVAA